MHNFNINAQTQLLLGPTEHVSEFLENSLKQIFSCTRVKQNEHANILWLKPEKQYTLDQLDIVFEKITFALDNNEKFFIIFESADLLNQACSNKLLKPIEEPKPGYYFIFLSQRKENILPTIRSRCVVSNFYTDTQILHSSELFSFFTQSNSSPIFFLKTLDKANISEQESIELLDALIKYFGEQAKQDLKNGNLENFTRTSNLINIFTDSFNKPPMPGSSKLFWKNLYLKL